MSVEEGITDSSRSFAELMNNFSKLTELESRIEAAIQNAKVPVQETRKFLKGMELNQVQNTPLSQFIQDLFKEIGLGALELSEKDNFKYTFRIKDSPICNLFKDVENKKVCEPTADAIYRFFSEDLGLEGEVAETKCLNIGDNLCEFKMDLQPFQIFNIAMDPVDVDIIKEMIMLEKININELAEKLQLDDDEVRARLTMMQYYEILDDSFHLTEVGKTFYNFRLSNPPKDEPYFDPPWKSMAELTSTIAATQSFAEALVVVAEEEKLPWEVDESELVDIKERAQDKASFAELLTSEFKDKKDDEENDEEEKENQENE
jgi:predicted hydrocarbon binding protein